jgi:hypothetical protein
MPVEWTTHEQKAFLTEELVTFKQIGGRRYTKRWTTLYQKWFQRWPERSILLPDLPEDAALTAEQKNNITEAVLQRQEQLRRWMHWHAGAGQNRAANNKTVKIINELLRPKTRTKKPWEVYSNMFFKTRIQPEIGTSGMLIADINKKIQEMFENESSDIREQVHKVSKMQKRDTKRRSKEAGDRLEKDPITLRR